MLCRVFDLINYKQNHFGQTLCECKTYTLPNKIKNWLTISDIYSHATPIWAFNFAPENKNKINRGKKPRSEMEPEIGNVSDTWRGAKKLLNPAADSRTHFHNWGLKGQHKWVGIVLSWLVIRMVLLSISFIHSYNYKWGPLYASDLTHTNTHNHTFSYMNNVPRECLDLKKIYK